MGRDQTRTVLKFFEGLRGSVRHGVSNERGHTGLSAIGLHLLLQSDLPAKEVLWAWYRYFDRDRGYSVYRTLAPWEDEALLEILKSCDFSWDTEAVYNSGLVFLQEHYREVLLCLGDVLGMRFDAYESMTEDELRERLATGFRSMEMHVGRLVREIRLRPLEMDKRHGLYETLSSDYLRATAVALLERAGTEDFWRTPPSELMFVQDRCEKLMFYLLTKARLLGMKGWSKVGEGHSPLAGMSEHLAVLGLNEDAELEDIRSAYRRLAKHNHPDQGGSVGEFLRVQQAYDSLIARWQ